MILPTQLFSNPSKLSVHQSHKPVSTAFSNHLPYPNTKNISFESLTYPLIASNWNWIHRICPIESSQRLVWNKAVLHYTVTMNSKSLFCINKIFKAGLEFLITNKVFTDSSAIYFKELWRYSTRDITWYTFWNPPHL